MTLSDDDYSMRKLIFSKDDFSKVRHHSPKTLDKVVLLQGKGVVGYSMERTY